MNKLWWEVLKVDKNANPEEVKTAYRKFTRMYHPDQYENMSSEIRNFHEEHLKEINAAYADYKKSQQNIQGHNPVYEQPSQRATYENKNTHSKEQIIFKVFLTVAKKYGTVGVEQVILQYISTGRLTFITRDENARELMRENVSTQDLSEYITRCFPASGLLESARIFISTLGIEKTAYLEIACIKTYERFEESHNDGFECMKGAIKASMSGVFRGFTNNDNARTNLQQNVKPEEIMPLIQSHLVNLGYDIQKADIDNYAEMIRNKILEQRYGK